MHKIIKTNLPYEEKYVCWILKFFFFWLKLLHGWRDGSIFQSTFCSCRGPTPIWWVIICPLLHPLGILKEPLLSCALRTILDLNILHPFGDCSSEFLIDLPVDLLMLCLMITFSSHLTYPVPWCKLLLAQSLIISSSEASCWLSITVERWTRWTV